MTLGQQIEDILVETHALLNAQPIEALLREAMRRQALGRFLQVSERVAAAGIPPMSEEEIQAEVDAVRRAGRKRLAPGR